MLVDFFEGFAAAVAARGFTGPVLLSRQGIARQTDPRLGRIVCVLGREAVGPTIRIGGNPRQVATRAGFFEMHIWGALAETDGVRDDVQSLRNAEALVQTAINAVKDCAVGTSTIDSCDWTRSEETTTVRAGWLAVLTMTVDVPIVDVTYPVSPPGPDAPAVDAAVILVGPNGGMVGP